MANFIQKFDNQAAYDSAEHDYPNVSYVVSGDTLLFAASEPANNKVVVYYNIEDATNEVTLWGDGGSSASEGASVTAPATMKVDGQDETVVNSWRFETTGEHVVEYTFVDDAISENFVKNVTSITKVEIYDIATIGDCAFKDINPLDVYVYPTVPPTILEYTVPFDSGCTIYVPSESVNTYKAATGWSDYAADIEAMQ